MKGALDHMILFVMTFILLTQAAEVSPEQYYNQRAESLAEKLNDVGDQYGKLRLSANAYANELNRRRKVMDINRKDASDLDFLREGVDTQARLLIERLESALKAAKAYRAGVKYLPSEAREISAESER